MSKEDGNQAFEGEAGTLSQDRADLHRGVILNTIGSLIKLAHPMLMGIAIWLYGEVIWGIFVTAQAALLPLGRLCMVGLDKGLLWWVPRQKREEERRSILPSMVLIVGLTSVAAILISTFLAPWLADWKELPEAESNIRWMSFGLIPMAIMDLFISACLGKRKMEAQVIVKDTLWPISMVVFALGFHGMGMTQLGFALAFVVSGVLAALASAWFFARAFKGSSWLSHDRSLPKPLVQYVIPMWGAEVTASWLNRMDQVVIFALTDAATAGVYGVVMMVGNAIRTIRRAFDPIVVAIFSGVEATGDMLRLRFNFSHATTLVIGSQMPVFAFILVFSPWILPLLGDSYESAITPITIICGFWLVNGALGLNGLILNGFGRSDLAFINIWITLGVEAFLLYALIPPYGLEGAAFAVGASYSVQNVIQAVQARWLTGAWNYESDVGIILGISAIGFGTMGAFWLISEGQAPESVVRIGSFVIFLLTTGPLSWLAYRKGVFDGPTS